jgi:multiple sugar transport system ATP-binding protein
VLAEIVLDDVWKVYPDGTVAVQALNLDIDDKEFVVLVGPSGCGKTTALRMIAGLESISEGTVRIGDRVVNDVPPKQRDIAMVFQNYALYPHMSVFENMAFGLKLQKVPKHEINTRVQEAARILGLDELLNRKPAALSGGQRQRVAMGRAIVRHPQAFLMDEPLSNLDAKLRVQMRSEIARIQNDLGVTTIYVTHDQTEAMTMGDRVAVIRKGQLQQVDAPQALYEHPRNLFVAGFIGSPAIEFGGFRLEVPSEVLEARPALRAYTDRKIAVGVRPEEMEDASLVAEAPESRRISVVIELVEALGSDVVVHFTIHATPALTDDVKELAIDIGDPIVDGDTPGSHTNVVARLNPRTRARKGEPIELVVDTSRLHFFDLEDSAAIYGKTSSHLDT